MKKHSTQIRITKSQFENLLETSSCKRIVRSYFRPEVDIYYACDNDILLSYNPKLNLYTKRSGCSEFLNEWDSIESRRNFNPLLEYQEELKHFSDDVVAKHTQRFWECLKMVPVPYHEIGLNHIHLVERRLNEFSPDFLLDNVALDFAIFCGEVLRSKIGGSWVIRKNMVYGTSRKSIKSADGTLTTIEVLDQNVVIRTDLNLVFITKSDEIEIDFVKIFLKNINERKKVVFTVIEKYFE